MCDKEDQVAKRGATDLAARCRAACVGVVWGTTGTSVPVVASSARRPGRAGHVRWGTRRKFCFAICRPGSGSEIRLPFAGFNDGSRGCWARETRREKTSSEIQALWRSRHELGRRTRRVRLAAVPYCSDAQASREISSCEYAGAGQRHAVGAITRAGSSAKRSWAIDWSVRGSREAVEGGEGKRKGRKKKEKNGGGGGGVEKEREAWHRSAKGKKEEGAESERSTLVRCTKVLKEKEYPEKVCRNNMWRCKKRKGGVYERIIGEWWV